MIVAALITKMLKMAEPLIVPIPKLLLLPNTSDNDVNNSGADEPAAKKVAPATFGLNFKYLDIRSNAGTKKSSHIFAIATNR